MLCKIKRCVQTLGLNLDLVVVGGFFMIGTKAGTLCGCFREFINKFQSLVVIYYKL